jgi:type VI secretion system protein ImpA
MNNLSDAISGENAFGVFLKDEKTTYRALRSAFNAAQASWRSLSETPESLSDREKAAANSAAWATLAELCEACLTSTSKDLEVLSWFVAAQLHSAKPFENCRDALALLSGLVETSLDQLHPMPPVEKLKGDTDEARASEIAALRMRPFVQLFGEVEGSGLLIGPMTNLNLIGEVTFGKITLAEKDGALDGIRADVSAHISAESDALTRKIEALQQMVVFIQTIETSVKSYAAQHSQTPPLIGYGVRLMKDVLTACEKMVDGTGFAWPGQDEGDAEPATAEGGNVDTDVETGAPVQGQKVAAGGGFNANLNVSNRHDALVAIAQLAGYFRKAEPHSPICLLLDRAVRWGNLNAADLYREILTEGSVGMSQMALMTGLESQGFSDNFARRGAGAAGTVEHPVLDNYAAAIPVPKDTSELSASAPQDFASTQAAPPAVQAVKPSVDPVAEEPTTDAEPVEAEQNLPVKSFQW